MLDPNDPDVQQLTQSARVEDAPDVGEPPSLPTFESPKRSEQGYFPSDHIVAPPFAPTPMGHSPVPSVHGMPPPPPASSQTQIPLQPSPQIPTKLPFPFTPPVATPGDDPSGPPSWSTSPSLPHPASSNPPPVMPPSSYAAPSSVQSSGYTTDPKVLNQAQKHAKFAISALNFEDVPTAVMELQNALAVLGAR